MKKIKYFLPLLFFCLSSCSCAPEELARFAFGGMESLLGGGFMPSEQLRALGGFTFTSVMILENGDPKILAENREILARECAELYLKEFEDAEEYDKITVQLVQSDPFNPENVSLEEYTFQVQDF